MPESLDLRHWMTVSEASQYMGCSVGWIYALLADGRLPQSRRLGQRVWLVSVADADRARESLSTRSAGKRHLAKRPAGRRAKKKHAGAKRKP